MSTEGLHDPPKPVSLKVVTNPVQSWFVQNSVSSFNLLVSAASFLDFCSLVCLLTVNIMTKKPQCNSGRTFLPASQEFLLPCASTVRFTAVTPLEDGAGLMNHLRDKVQRTSCNPTYTKAYTPIWCGSACNRGHAGDAASAQPTVDPKRNLWWYGWK